MLRPMAQRGSGDATTPTVHVKLPPMPIGEHVDSVALQVLSPSGELDRSLEYVDLEGEGELSKGDILIGFTLVAPTTAIAAGSPLVLFEARDEKRKRDAIVPLG